MEYTFNDWLEGKPEPTGLNWIYEKESLNTPQPKRNPVYLEISKAKKFTFDKALEFTLDSMKSHFLEKIENLNNPKRKLYIEKTILESERHFHDFDVRKLIDHNPPQKFEGINGKKYLQVKSQYEAFKEGKIRLCLNNLNKAFFAVVHFEMVEFSKEHLSNSPSTKELPYKPEKGKPFAIRYHLLKLLEFEKTTEFLTLPEGQKVAFLRFILACDESTAKGLKNGYDKYIQPKHEIEAKELFEKIKKGEIL